MSNATTECPATLNDIAAAIADDATRFPAPRVTRRCPVCEGLGHIVMGYDDCDVVERCLVCRATGRVRDTAIIFRAGSTWNLVDVCTLTGESVEDIVECADEWDEPGLMMVLEWCWQRKQDELESKMTIECNADVGHPCDANDGDPCPACAREEAEHRAEYDAATPAERRAVMTDPLVAA